MCPDGAAHSFPLVEQPPFPGATEAYSGQTITNPVSGENLTFRQTAADTDGDLLAFDLELTPDGHVPGLHVHGKQEERFEVVEGRMKFKLGLKTIIAEAGDVVVVPAGKAHKFENAGDEVAKARVEVRPALRMEDLLETTVQLAKEGRTNAKGMPKPSTSSSSPASSGPRCRVPSRPPGCSRPSSLRWPPSRVAAAMRTATRRPRPRPSPDPPSQANPRARGPGRGLSCVLRASGASGPDVRAVR